MKGAVLRARAVPQISHRVRAAPFAKVQAVHAQRSRRTRGAAAAAGGGRRAARSDEAAKGNAVVGRVTPRRGRFFTRPPACASTGDSVGALDAIEQAARRWRGGDGDRADVVASTARRRPSQPRPSKRRARHD